MSRIHKKTRYIRQDTVTCDTVKRHSVILKYHNDGFHCVSCGPKPIKFGVFDDKRHKLIFIMKVNSIEELKGLSK